MRAVIQRVNEASVSIEGQVVSQIEQGLLVLVGIGRNDSRADGDYLAEKIAGLRVFEDDAGKMNLSVLDIAGKILVVSQFTLYGDVRRGKRPSFSDAAPPDVANVLYEQFCRRLELLGAPVYQGVFQADMQVQLVNDGPVTILLESQRLF